MSGALSSAIGLPSASSLPAVFLGSISLGDFAIPEHIKLGGQQQYTTHKLPGGQRVFDENGDDPDPISFSGTFLGIQAPAQAMAVETLRKAGQPVTLAWGAFSFTVLVQQVHLRTGFNRVDFRISCLVVPDPSPDDDPNDDAALGDGEAADTPQTAQITKQAAVVRARANAAPLPIPPIPPSSLGSGQG